MLGAVAHHAIADTSRSTLSRLQKCHTTADAVSFAPIVYDHLPLAMPHIDLPYWVHERLADLSTGVQYLTKQFSPKSVESGADSVTLSVILTTASTALLLQALVILVTGLGRKQLLQGLETIVASFLLVCLLGLVLGLPVGESEGGILLSLYGYFTGAFSHTPN